MDIQSKSANQVEPWNKGKLMGAKPPLRPKHVWGGLFRWRGFTARRFPAPIGPAGSRPKGLPAPCARCIKPRIRATKERLWRTAEI